MLVETLARQLERADYSITVLPDGSAVLLDLHQECVLTFNGTGALILAGIGKGESEIAIAQQLAQKYAVDAATAGADVRRFIGELADAVGVKAAG